MRSFINLLLFIISPEESYDEAIHICQRKSFAEILKLLFWVAAAVFSAVLIGSLAC